MNQNGCCKITYVDGKFYSNPAYFNEISNKSAESHQHIWNIFVDLNKGIVTGISEEPERVMRENLQPNFIFSGMNMFMPDTVKVRAGSVLTWFNNSNLPHNVVGIYYKNIHLALPPRSLLLLLFLYQ